MSRSAADIVLLSSGRETLFIGPLAAFPVQARNVMLRDRFAVADALRLFLSRPGAEELVRPYLRRWGIDGLAMRAGDRAELAAILTLSAVNGAIALALAPEPVLALSRTGEDLDARVALALAGPPPTASLPDDFLDRLFIVAGMVPDHMQGAVRQEFEALVENGYAALLVSLVAMMIPGVNLAILGMSLFTLPGQVLEAIDRLLAVLEEVRNARSRKDLEGAAIAVAAVLAILLREGILRRFLSAKFVAKGMAVMGERFRKPTPKKTEMGAPRPVLSKNEQDGPLKASLFEIAMHNKKGRRPPTELYTKEHELKAHKQEFKNGASRFVLQKALKKYGPAQRDGTTFVLPKEEADKLLATTGGNKRKMEKALGLPHGALGNDKLVRIDIPDPEKLNVRMPSGNEAGVNALWIPGGKLPTGISEAVIDIGGADPASYTITIIEF